MSRKTSVADRPKVTSDSQSSFRLLRSETRILIL